MMALAINIKANIQHSNFERMLTVHKTSKYAAVANVGKAC